MFTYTSLFLYLYIWRWLYYARCISSVLFPDYTLTKDDISRGVIWTYMMSSHRKKIKTSYWKIVRMSIIHVYHYHVSPIEIWRRIRWRLSRRDHKDLEYLIYIMSCQASCRLTKSSYDMFRYDCAYAAQYIHMIYGSDVSYDILLCGTILKLCDDISMPYKSSFASVRPMRVAAIVWYYIKHNIHDDMIRSFLMYRLHVAMRPTYNSILFHQCTNAMLRHFNWKSSTLSPIPSTLTT